MLSRRKFVEEYLKKLPIGLIIALALLTGALYVFGVIINEVFWEQEDDFDRYVLSYFSTHIVQPDLTRFMEVVTHLASSRVMQIGYVLIVAVYLFRKKWKRAVEIVCIGAGGYFMNYLLKSLFGRTRPLNPLIDGVENFSFPSGHATSAFIFYGLLTFLVWKSNIKRIHKYILGILFISLSLLIGISRVYLRVHFPTDVLAGFCTGLAWLVSCILLFNYLGRKTAQQGQQQKRTA